MNIDTVVIDDDLFELARVLPNTIVKTYNECGEFIEIIVEFNDNDDIVAIYTKVSYANPIKSNLYTKEVYPNGLSFFRIDHRLIDAGWSIEVLRVSHGVDAIQMTYDSLPKGAQ